MPAKNRTSVIRAPRFGTKHQVRLSVTQPGASQSRFSMVTAKDVSTGGLGVLYKGYVHPGSKCEVQLITLYGSWLNVTGTVVRCRYVDQAYHEIGICFDSEIDVTLISPDANERHILFASNDEFMWQLVSAWLNKANSSQKQVNSKEDLFSALMNPVDLLIIDESFEEQSGLELISEIRRNGFFGFLVGMQNNNENNTAVLDAGADQAVTKPLSNEAVQDLLNASRVEPTVSSLSTDPSTQDVLERCIQIMNSLVIDAAEALRVERVEDLLEVTNKIGAVSGACGFEDIKETAAWVSERSVDQEIEKISTDFARLARLISAASA